MALRRVRFALLLTASAGSAQTRMRNRSTWLAWSQANLHPFMDEVEWGRLFEHPSQYNRTRSARHGVLKPLHSARKKCPNWNCSGHIARGIRREHPLYLVKSLSRVCIERIALDPSVARRAGASAKERQHGEPGAGGDVPFRAT